MKHAKEHTHRRGHVLTVSHLGIMHIYYKTVGLQMLQAKDFLRYL